MKKKKEKKGSLLGRFSGAHFSSKGVTQYYFALGFHSSTHTWAFSAGWSSDSYSFVARWEEDMQEAHLVNLS